MIMIRIDKNGLLWLRRNELKKTVCPFDVHNMAQCGDWCALFSVDRQNRFDNRPPLVVGLCHGKEHLCELDEFEDLRPEVES